MSTEERVQAVSQFLLQSPPGEINDVLNGPIIAFARYQHHVADVPPICADVRMLVGDDESLEAGVLPALQQYNLEQFTVAEVPGAGHTVSTTHSGLTIRTHLRLMRDVCSLL
jgi:capping protein alpha